MARQQLHHPYTAAAMIELPKMKVVKYTTHHVPSAVMLLHTALIALVALELLRYPVFG